MSQEVQKQSPKTEKPTWSYPSSRKTPTAYNVPASLEWIQDVPENKMLAGFIFDVKLTSVGAGMSTTRVSQIVKSLKCYADGKLALDIDQYALDLVPIVTNWAKHADDYASGTEQVGTAATQGVLVRDDANVATGASMYGFWKIHAPLPAARQLRFQLETYDGTAVFGAGMTGGVPDFSIVPIWANVGSRKQYNLYARQLSSVLKASYRGVEVGAFFTNAEWNTVSNGIKLGDALTVEQIYAIQSDVGNRMSVFAPAVGSAVNGRLLTFQDPLTAADTYVLANKFDGQAAADIAFTTSKTIQAIIMSSSSPDSIEVR